MPTVTNISQGLSFAIRGIWLLCVDLARGIRQLRLAPSQTPSTKKVMPKPTTAKPRDMTVNQAVIDSFPRRPTAEDFEAALVQCHTSAPGTCMHLLKIHAHPNTCFRTKNDGLILTPTSLAIGWSVSQRDVRFEYLHNLNTHYVGPFISNHDMTLHQILDHHYNKLPSTPKLPHYCSDCMMCCGTHGNVPMIRALLEVEPALAGLFLNQGVDANKPEVMTVIAGEYRSAIEPRDVAHALNTGIRSAIYPSVDLLVELFGTDINQEMYVQNFNEVCECSVPEGLKLMLDRFRDRLAFEDGFTFDLEYVKRKQRIVDILSEAYGPKFTKLLPYGRIKAYVSSLAKQFLYWKT